MDTKTLSGYWKESLSWLQEPELKTIILLTLNNFIRSLKTMMTYFNWLILLNLLLSYLLITSELSMLNLTNFDFFSSFKKLGALELIAILCNIITIFCYFLTARASLERKDLSYFARYYIPKFPWFLLFFLLGGKLLPMIMFFFLDAGNTLQDFFQSCKRGILMHFYFLPGLLCFTLVSIFVGLILAGSCVLLAWLLSSLYVLSVILYMLSTIIVFLMSFLMYSFYAIMYSKIKHSHYQLFFSK